MAKPKKCGHCKKPFTPRRPSVIQKYCSPACGYEAKKVRSSEERDCKNCGNKFQFAKSQLKAYKGAGQYCSRSCSYEGQAARRAKLPTNDRWERSYRTADKQWQQAVREKDDYACQRCGVRDPHIHTNHVATRKQRPDLKHVVDNGKCLCNSCHTWVHQHPLEAQELGLLSNARYELERLRLKGERTSVAKRQYDHVIPDVVRLHGEGLRPDAIASVVGCSGSTVRKLLAEQGISPYPPGRPR